MVASARTDIRQAGKMTQDVQEWLTKHGVQGEIANNTVADHRLDELETLVVELADRMQKCEQTMNSQFDAMQNELKILAWQLYAFIKWFELQTSLRKRV
jgi:TorA maturation chaperone TorD